MSFALNECAKPLKPASLDIRLNALLNEKTERKDE